MNSSGEIDVTYDFRCDTPDRRDPDTWSATLARYHEILWSKPLPNGRQWQLHATTRPPFYLQDKPEADGPWLSSDAVVPAFKPLAKTLKVPDEEIESFIGLGYTIGGMMVFPAVREGRHMTINGARGFHPSIRDRFDLTVECIRRYCRKEWSPLDVTLKRYDKFFELFGDFRGYVEFFLLEDLVTEDCGTVRFFLPCEDFRRSPLPRSIAEYRAYREAAMKFLAARNCRILKYCKTRE